MQLALLRRFSQLVGAIIGAAMGGMLYSIISNFFDGVWSTEYGVPVAVLASPIYLTAGICAFGGMMNVEEPLHMILGSFALGIIFGVFYLIVGSIILFAGGLFSSGVGGITVFVVLLSLIIGAGDVIVILFVN